MSLPDLNWRKLGRIWIQAPTTGRISTLLDAMEYALNTSTTPNDYKGDARGANAVTAVNKQVPGDSGVTEAVYWGYATGALTHKGLLAGQSSSTGFPRSASLALTPDTYASTVVMMNTVKNGSGAFGNWYNANPFSGGDTFGWWRAATYGSDPGVSGFDLYECREGVGFVSMNQLSGAAGGMTGAIWDPQSTDLGDAESDGRLYGQWTINSGIDFNFINEPKYDSDIVSNPTEHNGTDAADHCGTFDPGLSTKTNMQRASSYLFDVTNPDERTFTFFDGRAMVLGSIPYRRTADNIFIGSSRQWGFTRLLPFGAVLQSGGVDVAYAGWSNSITAPSSGTVALLA